MSGTVAAGGRLAGGKGTGSEGGEGEMASGVGMRSRSSSLRLCLEQPQEPQQPAPCSTG